MERETKPDRPNNTLREVLERKQNQLDEVLGELSEEIDLWNLRLEYAAGDDATDALRFESLAKEATMSLDQRWPFFGDSIHVSGSWLITDVTVSDNAITFPMVRQDAFNVVYSNGFAVMAADEDSVSPQIGLSFIYKQIPFISAAIQTNIDILTYANPREVSLTYFGPHDKESLHADMSDLGKQIGFYDQLLYLHYHNENSEFYKKSALKQQQFLNDMTDKINDSLPPPVNGFKAICEQIQVPYFYRRTSGPSGNKWEQIKAADSEPILLNGLIEGVGILETIELMNRDALRGAQSLVDPNAGICLILKVEECSIPDIFNGNPVYVPLRIACDLDITVP